jgi:hypothetical protein
MPEGKFAGLHVTDGIRVSDKKGNEIVEIQASRKRKLPDQPHSILRNKLQPFTQCLWPSH